MHRVNESLIHTLYKITHVAIILFVILLEHRTTYIKRTSGVNDPWLVYKLHETRKIIVHICMKLNNIKLIMMLKINMYTMLAEQKRHIYHNHIYMRHYSLF